MALEKKIISHKVSLSYATCLPLAVLVLPMYPDSHSCVYTPKKYSN